MREIEITPEGFKNCTKCKNDKLATEFYPNPAMKSGFRSRCMECEKKHKKPKTKEQIKNTRLKCAFGITLADYKVMYDAQNGLCKICDRPETVENRKGIISMLAVDHCHTTGKIRGLLCQKCNSGLGKFEDEEERMLKAVEYLRASR